uniref:At4g15545-like C-terminal domain-containing protein n=1 Tax=Oryza glumipatula TaxID=40148 RepID=A0A0D9ZI35_9ORYZ
MPLAEGEFALPDEVLAVMPRDPYEQLDLARRITALAVAGRVTGLEREAARLRESAADKDRENGELRERVALLDRALQETNSRLRAALEDNIKLSKERDSLAQTSKKLARDLQKLESFKRHLMQSLRDDSPSKMSGTNLSLIFSLNIADGDSITHTTTNLLSTSLDVGSTVQEGRTPRIDGKEFFRQARSRLSYEQFGAFLANIKELNAHKQSREDTLKKAEEIFGPDNKDLYLSFQGLLNRSLP